MQQNSIAHVLQHHDMATYSPDAAYLPLPLGDGPQRKPFDFGGPQTIEFLEVVGVGGHSQVFEVKILGNLYTLKVVSLVSTNKTIARTCDPLMFVSSSFQTTAPAIASITKLLTAKL